MDPYASSGYSGEQGYNYQQYNDAYNQSGYAPPTNSSDYYYGSGQTPAGGTSSNTPNVGQATQQPPLQPQQTSVQPLITQQQQVPPPAAASQGYSHPRTDTYDASNYATAGYYNYPSPAPTGSYQANSIPPAAGAINSNPPPFHTGGGYGSAPTPQNKPSYDRVGEYGESSGNSSYGGGKNPYGESYGGVSGSGGGGGGGGGGSGGSGGSSGSAYKPREAVRDTGFPLPPKESSYESYAARGSEEGGYKDFNEDSVVHTSTDTIYISNLSKDVTEEKLANFFGGLGRIKIDKRTQKPKIWIYYDKVSGIPKGDATLTYEDPDATSAAIEWFHNKEFLGQLIKVEMSVRKLGPAGFSNRGSGGRSRPRGRGFGGGRGSDRGAPGGSGAAVGGGSGGSGSGGGGRGGPPPREGDWMCDSCNANNFARRTECYKCHAPRTDGPTEDGGFGGGRYSSGGGGGSGTSSRGGYRGRRGGGPSYGSGNGRFDDDRGYASGGGYRNNDSSYGGGYDQGYGRQNKQDDRRDNSRFRPY